MKELLEDYPALSADDVSYSGMHVALGRRPGRPRKKLRLPPRIEDGARRHRQRTVLRSSLDFLRAWEWIYF
jgi:hypothetical protein